MSYRQFTLKAGMPIQANVPGRVILIDDIGNAEGLHVTPMRGGQELATMPNRKKAFKCFVEYDTIILAADVDCVVALFLGMNDVSLGFTDGALMNVQGKVSIENEPDHRIPVALDPQTRLAVDMQGATVNVTATQVGNQALNSIVDLPVKVIGLAAISVSNDPTLRRLRFRNMSADANIALGGAGVNLQSPIVLPPGAVYFEEDAAGANWYAVADKAGVNLSLQGLKA